MEKLEEIRNELKEKLEQNIQYCLDKLNELQRKPEWQFVRPNIYKFTQEYLNFQLNRRILHWSFRQKMAQYEILRLELFFFIDGLSVFEYQGEENMLISINGNNNTLVNNAQHSQINTNNSPEHSNS